MKKLLVTVYISLFLSSLDIRSQSIVNGDPISKSMGGIRTLNQNIWATFNNPSCLSYLNSTRVGFNNHRIFGLRGLNQFEVAAAIPSKSAVLGIGVNRLQFHSYSSTNVFFSSGLGLSSKLKSGFSITYGRIKQRELYDVNHTFTANLGLIFQIRHNWLIGVLSNSLIGNTFKVNNNKLFGSEAIGVQHRLSDELNLLCELELNVQTKVIVKSGLEFIPSNRSKIRIGTKNYPPSISVGYGFEGRGYEINMAFTYSRILGTDPSTSITFMKNKTDE